MSSTCKRKKNQLTRNDRKKKTTANSAFIGKDNK